MSSDHANRHQVAYPPVSPVSGGIAFIDVKTCLHSVQAVRSEMGHPLSFIIMLTNHLQAQSWQPSPCIRVPFLATRF